MTKRFENITAVLFDMDETLIEHTRTGLEICQEVYASFSDRLVDIDESAFMQTLWRKANDMWSMMIDGAISGEVARPYTFINTLRGLNGDESLASPMGEVFERLMLDSTQLQDGAIEVMSQLRTAGITIGVVTNGYTSMQRMKIRAHGLDERSDFVLISEEVGSHKPDGGIFRQALHKANAAPHEAVFVGDNPRADILGALSEGIHAVLLDPSGSTQRKIAEDESLKTPSHVIECLFEVPPMIGLAESPALRS